MSGKIGLSYQFGICKAPSFCPDGCGACSSLHSSMGVVNSELRMGEAGYPYLIYPNGPACKDLKNQSTNYVTKIQFTCAATPEEKNKATLVEEADCSLIIDFATDKVCDKAISCADDGFDLSPLIRSKSNFVADVAGDVLKNATNKDVKVGNHKKVTRIITQQIFFFPVLSQRLPSFGLSIWPELPRRISSVPCECGFGKARE